MKSTNVVPFQDTLTNFLIEAVEVWRKAHPNMTVDEVRGALHNLIESFESITKPPSAEIINLFDGAPLPNGSPSPEVMAAAHDIADMADSGEIQYLAATVVHRDGSTSCRLVGDTIEGRSVIGGLEVLKAKILQDEAMLMVPVEPLGSSDS